MLTAAGLNDGLEHRLAALRDRAAVARITVTSGAQGETLIDAGLGTRGSLAAGLAIAEIAMAGLADVRLEPFAGSDTPAWFVAVRSSQPVLACLGSQYAGWHLEADGFRGLGSGPARALAAREAVFDALGFRDSSASGVLLIETDRLPPPAVVSEIADSCGLHPSRLTLILVPTPTLVGSVQVAARALESAVAKARHAGFPLDHLLDGFATCPLAPPHPEPAVAMGRTNDAILYGAAVHLFVAGPDDAAAAMADHLPSARSAQHGRHFAEVLAEAGGDFYRVDAALFGPAQVRVTAIDSGATFESGRLDPDMVRRSFTRGG